MGLEDRVLFAVHVAVGGGQRPGGSTRGHSGCWCCSDSGSALSALWKLSELYTQGSCTFLNAQLFHEIMVCVMFSYISEIEHKTYLDTPFFPPSISPQTVSFTRFTCRSNVCVLTTSGQHFGPLTVSEALPSSPETQPWEISVCLHRWKCPQLQICGVSYQSLFVICSVVRMYAFCGPNSWLCRGVFCCCVCVGKKVFL